MSKKHNEPIHPGEVLADELEFIGLNAAQLAEKIGVPANRIYQIVNEQRNITADTAVRLAKFFDMTPHFWMNLQKSYELDLIDQALPDFQSIQPYQQQASG